MMDRSLHVIFSLRATIKVTIYRYHKRDIRIRYGNSKRSVDKFN